MANLRNYLNTNITSGTVSELFVYPLVTVKVGEAAWTRVEELHAVATMSVNIAGVIRVDKLPVEVIMDGPGSRGVCTLVIGDRRMEKVPYEATDRLRIRPADFPVALIELYRGDRAWSWVGAAGMSIGAWPKGKGLEAEDTLLENTGLLG